MKKVKFEGKLNLNKVIVEKLNNDQMKNVVGGGNHSKQPSTTRFTINTYGLWCTYSG
ncbi:class I lanthipeptide [Flavobacterium pectinovorum]|uniref:class I lanthipeptide n=1 Tax=Flavobacterium pectinovorum TaxID=29533 RepID=UPI00137613E6|nr:class I lanthipeptide [Flavobacterium pectinovorum]